MKQTYTIEVLKRANVPCCRESDCDDDTHWVRVTIYLNGEKVWSEPEYKTFKKGA